VGQGPKDSVHNHRGRIRGASDQIIRPLTTVQSIPNACVPLSCTPHPGEITLSADGQTVGFGAYSDGTELTQSGPYNGYFSYDSGTGQVSIINAFSVGPSDLNGAGGICPSLGLSADGLTAYLVAYFPPGSSGPASPLSSTLRIQRPMDDNSSSPTSEIYQVPMPGSSGGGVAQTITFNALASGVVGRSTTLSATGGASGNPVVFSIDPASGTGACNVAGTNGSRLRYTTAGSCVIDANQAGNSTYAAAGTVTRSIQITVIAITNTSLPNGALKKYSTKLKAVGGNPPYTWSLVSGSGQLPPGLSLDQSTGTISGTPKRVGTFIFTIEVADTKTKTKPKTQHTATKQLSITISQ
jgi:hypothetical protein